MLKSDLCDHSDAFIVAKGTITFEGDDDNKKEIKSYPLRIMLHLDHVYQKSTTHLYTMQKILILLCQCIIC